MTDYYYLCKNQTRNCGPSHFLCAIIDTQMNNPHCWAKANKDQIWERERKRERKEARQGGRERERNKGWNRDDGREWDPGFSKRDTNTKDPVPDSVSKMEPRIPVGTFVHAQFGTTEACMAQTCFYFTDSAACIIHPSPLFSPGSLHHRSPPPPHKHEVLLHETHHPYRQKGRRRKFKTPRQSPGRKEWTWKRNNLLSSSCPSVFSHLRAEPQKPQEFKPLPPPPPFWRRGAWVQTCFPTATLSSSPADRFFSNSGHLDTWTPGWYTRTKAKIPAKVWKWIKCPSHFDGNVPHPLPQSITPAENQTDAAEKHDTKTPLKRKRHLGQSSQLGRHAGCFCPWRFCLVCKVLLFLISISCHLKNNLYFFKKKIQISKSSGKSTNCLIQGDGCQKLSCSCLF